MLNWRKARDYMASLFGAPNWDRLSEANQRLGQGSINAAVDTCWDAMDPSRRIAEGVLRLRDSEDILIAASAGNNYVTTSAPFDSSWIHQKLFFNGEVHEIASLDVVGGENGVFFRNDTVAADFQGQGTVDYRFYLLPPDFMSFDEIPHTIAPRTDTARAAQYLEHQDLLLFNTSAYNDYVAEVGEVLITADATSRNYLISGQGTAFTSALAGQVMVADGRYWHIRHVDVATQTLTSWVAMTKDTGVTDVSTTAVPYELVLAGRTGVQVLASARDDVAYVYRREAPADGLDMETIPIPIERAVTLWMQYYWITQTDTGSNLANAQEAQMLLAAADEVLVDLRNSTRPYDGGIDKYEVSGSDRALRTPRDTRVAYYGFTSQDPRRAFPRPDGRYGGQRTRSRDTYWGSRRGGRG